MKKIILSLTTFLLIGSVKAQWIIQAINPLTGETKYISLPSGATGVNSVNGRTGAVILTKNDVGLSAVENLSISATVQNAVNNLQTLINQKQNTLIPGNNISIVNNVISSTGGGGGTVTAPLNLTIAPMNNFVTYTPTNYLQKYPTIFWPGHTEMQAMRWEYSYRSDFSGDNMPDNVFNLSYNLTPQGNKYSQLNVGIREGWEDNYRIGQRLAIEHHKEIFTLNNTLSRIQSDYIYKDNGETFREVRIDNYKFYSALLKGGTVWQGQYMDIHSNRGAELGGIIDFYAEKNSSIGSEINFNQAGYIKAGIRGQFGNISFRTNGDNVRNIIDAVGNFYANFTGGSTWIGTQNPNLKAKLQVESTTQGVMLVRMTTAQRLAMNLTVNDEGMEVYDLTLHKKIVWDGSVWQSCW